MCLTGLQVKLTEVLGSAEGDHNHTMPEDVIPCGHFESELCVGDETVLLDHWVDSLHPAVTKVYPGKRDNKNKCIKATFVYLRLSVYIF